MISLSCPHFSQPNPNHVAGYLNPAAAPAPPRADAVKPCRVSHFDDDDDVAPVAPPPPPPPAEDSHAAWGMRDLS